MSQSYDLKDLVEKIVPKDQEQERRTNATSRGNESLSYNVDGLTGNNQVITKNYLTPDWKYIHCSRMARNKVANFVGGNADNISIPQRKSLIVNSEFMRESVYLSYPNHIHLRPMGKLRGLH